MSAMGRNQLVATGRNRPVAVVVTNAAGLDFCPLQNKVSGWNTSQASCEQHITVRGMCAVLRAVAPIDDMLRSSICLQLGKIERSPPSSHPEGTMMNLTSTNWPSFDVTPWVGLLALSQVASVEAAGRENFSPRPSMARRAPWTTNCMCPAASATLPCRWW